MQPSIFILFEITSHRLRPVEAELWLESYVLGGIQRIVRLGVEAIESSLLEVDEAQEALLILLLLWGVAITLPYCLWRLHIVSLHSILEAQLRLVKLLEISGVLARFISTKAVNQLSLCCQPDLRWIINNCFIVSEEVILVRGFVIERCSDRDKLLLKLSRNCGRTLYRLEPSDGPALNTCKKLAVFTPLVFQLDLVIRMFYLPICKHLSRHIMIQLLPFEQILRLDHRLHMHWIGFWVLQKLMPWVRDTRQSRHNSLRRLAALQPLLLYFVIHPRSLFLRHVVVLLIPDPSSRSEVFDPEAGPSG